MTTLLERAAERARERPDFLASDLEAYRAARDLSRDRLAHELGIGRDVLPSLELCSTPRRDRSFAKDIAALAGHVKARPAALASIVRFADGLHWIRRAPALRQAGLLAAARDRAPERTTPTLPPIGSPSTAQWLIDAASQLWADSEPKRYPRDLELSILWTLPLGLVSVPALSTASLSKWLSARKVPWPMDHTDRPLRSCLLVFGGAGLIFLDQDDDEAETRLSLAHEVAHFLRDYLSPRAAIEQRAPALLDVIDGIRDATTDDEVDALLAHVELGFFSHLFTRTSVGDYAHRGQVAHEDAAARLAWHLLAPVEDVIARTTGAAPDELVSVLVRDFGFPEHAASDYGRYLARLAPQPLDVRTRFGLTD